MPRLATLARLTAKGAYKVTWSGATRRYVRLNVTSLGGTTGLDLVCIVCVRGVTE